MPRGHHNNHNRPGRGRDRGRFHWRGRATAPAGASYSSNRPYPHTNTETDVVIQQWSEPDPSEVGNRNLNGGSGPRRRGIPRLRSGAGTPSRGVDSPRLGNSTPRGRGRGGAGGARGRGRGRGFEPNNGFARSRPARPGVGSAVKMKAMIGKDAPLAEFLYSERPLLRPVTFVRAKLTPFLFQHSEDVLKPTVDSNPESSHVPTADRVARLFHENASNSDSDSDDHAQDPLEEIDFADLARLREEVDMIARGDMMTVQDIHDTQKYIEEVDFADLAVLRAQVDGAEPMATARDDVLEVSAGVCSQVKDSTQVVTSTIIDGSPAIKLSIKMSNESNHGSDTTQASGTVNDAQRKEPSALSVLNKSPTLKRSMEISNESHRECLSQIQDTVIGVPSRSSDEALGTHSAPVLSNDLSPPQDTMEQDDTHPLFVIDITPLPLTRRPTSDVILVDRTGHGETLGDDDDETIVYVAPHPRSGCASPLPVIGPIQPVRLSSVVTGRSVGTRGIGSPIREDDVDQEVAAADIEPANLSLAAPSLSTGDAPRTDSRAARKVRKKETQLQRMHQRQRKRGRVRFGAFGAMMSEAMLREENAQERRRPRWETRRRGDSDLDWGTGDEDEEGDGVDELSNDLGGMEIDSDIDPDAMRGFLKSMSAEGSKFMTMDDIEDEARLQQEDEEGQGAPQGSSDSETSGGDDEDEAVEDDEREVVFNLEEKVLIVESDSEELSPDSDDDELSPKSGFKARLARVRQQSRPANGPNIFDSDEERTHGAEDEEFLAHINDILDENNNILSGRNRSQKKTLFRHLHQGYVDDAEYTTPRQKKGKGKEFTGAFAAELQAQWAKDRAKKAEWRRERAETRLLAALDPLGSPKGKRSRYEKGGASKKAIRAAARLDPTAARALTPRAIVDVDSLEAQIRRFANEARAGTRTSMALPPMDKVMCKVVHELAAMFGINSVSKGKGTERYTTLFRMSRTGVAVKEEKVKALIRRYGRAGSVRGGRGGEGKGKRGQMPKHRDGDEVGKEAPKIGESNIGFRMLASMGWSEGDRIGGSTSAGIEVPLTAIIKRSKLGLGATRIS